MTAQAIAFGAFVGLVGAVAIYHLLMFAILRAPEFLSYGAYLAALTLFQFARNPQYLFALGITVNVNVLFWWSFALLAFLGYWLFRSFLDLPSTQPRLARTFLIVAVVTSLAALVKPWMSPVFAELLELAAVVLLVVAALTLFAALRLGSRAARYFGIAYAGFFVFTVMRLIYDHAPGALGIATPLFAGGIEFGVAFQALTLALGLADRIAAANEERDRAQRHTIEEIGSLNVAYARFVPRAFLDLLGKDDVRDVRLGDSIGRKMTVLFSDVRSFTTISESLSPDETFGFINELLSCTGPVIREHGGIVDKYVGDAIMALFPGSVDDALRAAIALQHAVGGLNAERERTGRTPIAVGVGLHHGSLMLGTIGEHERMDGTVIADAVNVASRVEGLTKYFGAHVLISEDLRAALRDAGSYAMRYLGRVAMQGKRQGVGVGIYEVLDGDAPDRRAAKHASDEAFGSAVAAFVAGAFADAARAFDGILADDEHDGAARYLHGRATALAAAGLPWDGIDRADK